MRKSLASAVATLAVVFAAQGVSEAQIHQRWKLDYSQEKPQIYTYRHPQGGLENYWFMVYTIENNTTQVVPILLDHMMYTETGKDLQADLRKVDPEPTKATGADPKKYEPLKYGKFTSNVTVPQAIEYKIIEYHSKIGNRSEGIIRESIESLKKGNEAGNRYYLNPREMREQRFIKPGQKLQGIAIFIDIEARARIIEVHISGLWDVLRIEQFVGAQNELEEVKIHYENRVYKYSYEFKGDEFEREKDVLTLKRQPDWTIKNIGPIASKQTLENLISTLLKVLQKWEDCIKQNMTPADIDKEIAKFNLNKMDFDISARVIGVALGKDFGYDNAKTLMDNQGAVWRLHEWWVTNKNKLAFNEVTGRFEVREEILPGQVRD